MSEAMDALAGTMYGLIDSTMTAREAACGIWDITQMAKSCIERGSKLDSLRALLMYAVEVPGTRRKTPVDVQALVKEWVPIIRGLSAAHDKAELDRCEYEMDTHLSPLLSAPIAQIREFFAQLVLALEADPTIPFFVHAMFRAWGDVILKKAPDGDVIALKKTLATRIADLVEQDVRPDLHAALAGALEWRSPESLAKIAAAVEAGGKPRMVGRSSCLFLQVGDATVML